MRIGLPLDSGRYWLPPIIILYLSTSNGICCWSEHKASIKKVKVSTGFENIIDEAFSDCTELVEAIVPQAILTTVGNNVFKGCTKLSKVESSGKITGFPNTVTSFGSGVFDDCPSAPFTTDESGAKYFPSNSNPANPYYFLVGADSSITNCEVNAQTVIIAGAAFKGLQQLTSVTISDSVTTIGNSAFENCVNLHDVVIGDKVVNIGADAFKNTNLKNKTEDHLQYLGGSSNPYIILTGCDDKSITSCVISDQTKIVGDYVFADCTKLKSVTLGANIRSIGAHSFENCGALDSVTLGRNSHIDLLSQVVPVEKIKHYTIGGEITRIKDNAFIDISSMESVQLLETVTSIGNGAFSGCTSLKSLEISGEITSIGIAAFSNCISLESITVPGTVSKISNSAFFGCRGLKTVIIKEGVTAIGCNAFKHCENLEAISIPKSVTSIQNGAFDLCYNLGTLTIENGVESIGNFAFERCNKLETITIPASVNNISNKAFVQCSSLKTVSYLGTSDPGREHEEVFYGCDNLEEIKVPGDYKDPLFCGSKTGVLHSAAILDSKPTKWFITFITLLVCYLVL